MTIRLENLVHVYKNSAAEERPVVDITEWTIHPGDHILLRGVSGSGKTTLFNIMTGLLHPSQGSVLYDSVSLYGLSEATRDRFRARNIGYIFQSHFLLNTMTSLENVEMPMAVAHAMPRSQWRKRAKALLEQVGLENRMNHYPAQLSTGQRMRVAVVRALANQPNAVFADEPTASLDEDAADMVMDLIEATCQENDAMLIVASHDPALAQRFEQVVHLQAGKLQSEVAHHDV